MDQILLQQIRDKLAGVTSAQYGTMNRSLYLQEIRDLILGAVNRVHGTMNELIYLQQIRNAILGVPDGQFGTMSRQLYLQEIRDAFSGLTVGNEQGSMEDDLYLEEILAVASIGSLPSAPTGLVATPISTSRIDLSWTDNATDEENYRIYRSTNGVTYSLIDTIPANSNSYSDTTITAGTFYYYKVAALNGSGETLSNTATATTLTLINSFYPFSVNFTDSLGVRNLAGSPGSPSIGADGVIGDGTNFLVITGLADNLQTNGCTGWAFIKVSNYTGRKGILQDSASTNMSLTVESSGVIQFVVNDSVSGNSVASKTGLSLLTGISYFVWGRYDKDTKRAEVGYDAVAGTVASTPLTNGARTIASLSVLRGAATIANNCSIRRAGYALRKLTDAELASLRNGGAGIDYPFIP